MPIVPVRYGIAPDKVFSDSTDRQVQGQAPDVAERFVPPESGIELGEHEHYTLRIMRSGYLFVYDEIGGQWTAYAVTDEGYFFRVPLDDANPPDAAPFACSRKAADIALASVITIDDPESAGNIWFGFSEVWWPQAVRKANEDADTRKKHMRCIDVGAWYNNQKLSAERAYPVSVIDWAVADYTMKSVPGVLSFVWSPFKFQYKQPEAETLKQACDGLAEDKGLILALEDPAGIAQELSAYAAARWDVFLGQTDPESAAPDTPWSRKIQLDNDLAALERAVKKNAEHKIFTEAAQEVTFVQSRTAVTLDRMNTRLDMERARMGPDADVPERVTSLKGRIETVEERRKRFDQVTLEKSTLASAREQAWGKYKPLINDTERNTFHTNFQTASQTYDAEYIKPVAEAHARWLKSSMFKAVLEHHFDPEDINAGLALAALVYICVSGTSALAPCQKLYEQWLKEGPSSDNPLWRAFRLNNDTLADQLQQASPVIPTTGWEALWQAYTDTLAKLKMPGDISEWRKATADVLNPLMVELSTPTAKVVAQYPNDTPGKALQAMLGMHAGKPVQVVEVVGTRRQLYSAMVKQLLRMSQGKAMNLGDFQAAVDEQMAIWRAQGVPLDDEIRHWALMFDDTAMAEAAQANLSPGERAQKVVAGTAPPAELDKKAGRVITVDPDSFMGQTIELARMPTLVSSGALILGIVSLESFMAKERDALKGASDRAWWMVKSAWAGVIGGTFDLVGAVIASNVTARIPLARTLAARLSGRLTLLFIQGAGLAGGFVAIGIASVVDFWSSYEAAIQGEYGLAILYFTSFMTKGIVAGMFLALLRRLIIYGVAPELGPLGWTLIALTFALDWIISWVNDPATMDWTGDCLWGTHDASTYDNGREEHADFLEAVGLA